LRNPEWVALQAKISKLVLDQIQLDKGMPLIELLNPDIEELIIGQDDPRLNSRFEK